MRKNSYISYEVCEALAQNQVGIAELIGKTDNLLESSFASLEELVSTEVLDKLISSLPYYGKYIYTRDRICEVHEYFTEYTLTERIKRIENYAQAVDSLLEELERIERNPVWITRVCTILGQPEENIDRTDFYQKLAKRRAYLRTRLNTLSHLLDSSTDHNSDIPLLQEKLQLFTVLDAYPNIPEDDEQASKLARMLDILEPLEKKLTNTLEASQQPKVQPSFKTIIPTNKDTETEPSSVENYAYQAPNSFYVPEESDEFDDFEPEIEETENIDQLEDEDLPTEQSSLGLYHLQRGDTFADVLLGYTEAGTLPIFSELTAHDQRKLIRDTRRYFINNPNLFSYIGIKERVSELSDVTEAATISLDKLHDVCCLIAHQKGMIRLPEDVLTGIRRQIKNLSTVSRNKTPTKRASRIDHGQEVDPVNQAISTFYKGDQQMFFEDVELWCSESLALRGHSITPLLSLPYQQWLDLVNDSNLRYRYLTENNIPLSVFQRFSDKVRRWRQAILMASNFDITQLVMIDIVARAFVNEVLRDKIS